MRRTVSLDLILLFCSCGLYGCVQIFVDIIKNTFVGGSTTSPNKSKMADGAHIEFRKMLICPYWIKMFAPNLIQKFNILGRLRTTTARRLSAYITGHFTFLISLSLRGSLSPQFGLRPKISQKVKLFFVWTQIR